MDIKKLAQVLLVLGGLLALAALIWWGYFYGQVVKELGGNLGDAFSCLYSSSGPCGFVSGFAQMGGVTPYNPALLWIGVALFAVGLIVKLSLAPQGTEGTVDGSTNKNTASTLTQIRLKPLALILLPIAFFALGAYTNPTIDNYDQYIRHLLVHGRANNNVDQTLGVRPSHDVLNSSIRPRTERSFPRTAPTVRWSG